MDAEDMNVLSSLSRFIESTASEHMPDAASQLVDLLEADEVEPLSAPGKPVLAEDIADRLEDRLRRTRFAVEDRRVIEDAVAHLRAREGATLAPWSFEDGEGVRWFLLADDEEDIVACYTSEVFRESEV